MRRFVAAAGALVVVLCWAAIARAQTEERHRVYLPYLRRDATPTPTATATPAPTPTHDPLTCPNILPDPSVETAAGNDILENVDINLFPNDGRWAGAIDGAHWLVGTRRDTLPLIDAPGAARTGKWALSFLGNGRMGSAMAFNKMGVGVKTGTSVRSAVAVFWYRLIANSDTGFDQLFVDVVGFDKLDRAHVGAITMRKLPSRRSDMRESWTQEVVDMDPYVHGHTPFGARWNAVGYRFFLTDGDASTVSNWLIDDVELRVCFN